jgi:hypothetical protein
MGIVDPGWTLLGTPFRCHGVPAGLATDLSALLRGFPPVDPSAEAVELSLRAGEDATAAQIEYYLVNEAIARAQGRWILHAGAVETPRGVCLIIGESGAGKTSLNLWLLSGGLRLVTDDLCPILHGSLTAERFPRALHMDCEYSPLLLARIPPRPPSYPADYYPFPDASDGTPTPPPITDLLVLQRGPRPEGELEPLSQSEAAHHLLAAVIKSPGFDYGQALVDMIQIASRCRSHRLRASTPEGAGAAALAHLTIPPAS